MLISSVILCVHQRLSRAKDNEDVGLRSLSGSVVGSTATDFPAQKSKRVHFECDISFLHIINSTEEINS